MERVLRKTYTSNNKIRKFDKEKTFDDFFGVDGGFAKGYDGDIR